MLLLALQHFEVYVGESVQPVVVHTDHNPFMFLTQICNANQCLMRWALIVQYFNLEKRHKKGVSNLVADALSRASLLSPTICYFGLLFFAVGGDCESLSVHSWAVSFECAISFEYVPQVLHAVSLGGCRIGSSDVLPTHHSSTAPSPQTWPRLPSATISCFQSSEKKPLFATLRSSCSFF